MCLLNTFNSSSQGIIELPTTNILYKEYNNKIIVGFNECYGYLKLTSEDAFVLKTMDGWIVRPFRNRRTVVLKLTDSLSTINEEYSFRATKLPVPTVYWGTSQQGAIISRDETKLFCRYEPFFMLDNSDFKIQEYRVVVKGKVFTGEGKNITEELTNHLKSLPSETEVNISLRVINENGIQHEIDQNFKLE